MSAMPFTVLSPWTLVPANVFAEIFEAAWDNVPAIREACSDFRDASAVDGAAYVSTDARSGFVVRADGELVGVFSRVRGRGDDIVSAAIDRGATRLDCFDGYLTGLYARHGFVEYDRAENWTAGAPDVVFMARPHAHRYDFALSDWHCDTCHTSTDFCEDVTR